MYNVIGCIRVGRKLGLEIIGEGDEREFLELIQISEFRVLKAYLSFGFYELRVRNRD